MRAKGDSEKGKQNLQVFTALENVECIAMDILSALTETKTGNAFITVMTHQYSKMKGGTHT